MLLRELVPGPVRFCGYLGYHARSHRTPRGLAVVQLRLARPLQRVTEDGELQELTTWYDVRALGGAAEKILAAGLLPKLRKGVSVWVQGEFSIREHPARGDPTERVVQSNNVLAWNVRLTQRPLWGRYPPSVGDLPDDLPF